MKLKDVLRKNPGMEGIGDAHAKLYHGGRKPSMWAVADVQNGLLENVVAFETRPPAVDYANGVMREYEKGRSIAWDETEFEMGTGGRSVSWHSKDGQFDVYLWDVEVRA